MAWSDAARVAAAAARRMHGGATKNIYGIGQHAWSPLSSKDRFNLARNIKKMRAGKSLASEARRKQVIERAAVSTRLRNIARMKLRGK